MVLQTTSTSLRRLPLFFAHCPDKAGALAKRMEVRPTHLKRWQKNREEGYGEFGLGYLTPRSSSTSINHAEAPPVDPSMAMAGSLMIFRSENLAEAWKMIKTDVYWTEGVWDQEKVSVNEFIRNELYNDDPEDK